MAKELVVGIDLGGKDKTWATFREGETIKSILKIDSIQGIIENILNLMKTTNFPKVILVIDGTLSYPTDERTFRECDLRWRSRANSIHWVSSPNSLQGTVTLKAVSMVAEIERELIKKSVNYEIVECHPRVFLYHLFKDSTERLNLLNDYKGDSKDHKVLMNACNSIWEILPIPSELKNISINDDIIDSVACCLSYGETKRKKYPDNEVLFTDRERTFYMDLD